MKKPLQWVVMIVSVILLIFILLLFIIHTTRAKNFIRGKLEAYLIAKTHTKLHISAINYRLPKWVELDGVYLQDRSGDTLLFGGKLRVDINMLALLKGQYMISKVKLDNIVVHISRNAYALEFNYQFLIDAFTNASPQVSKKSAFAISLDEIEIAHSAIAWHDNYGGTIMDTRIGSFHATIDSLDIFAQKYIVSKAAIADMVFDLQLSNTRDNPPLIPTDKQTPTSYLPVIKIRQAAIVRSHFGLDEQNKGIHTVNDINELKLTDFSMASTEKLTIGQLALLNSSLLLNTNAVTNKSGHPLQNNTSPGNFNYRVKHAVLLNNTLSINDQSVNRNGNGLDVNHLQISSLSGGLSGFSYMGSNLTIQVDSLSGKEKNGFILDSLRGNLTLNDKSFIANQVLIKTPLSRISGNMTLFPESIHDSYRGNLRNHFQFFNSVIAKKDLLFIAPVQMEKYKSQLAGVSFIYLTAAITGNAKRMDIQTFSIHSDKKDIYMDASGVLYNAFSSDHLQYDLFITKAIASKGFLEPFINKAGKQTIYLPPSLYIAGTLKGNLKQVTGDLLIKSAYGTAVFKGQVKNFTKPDQFGYDMQIIAKELETGKWFNQDSTWGKLTGNIQVKGTGIDYKHANLASRIDLNAFRIKQHNYSGIKFSLHGIQGAYDITGNIADSLLRVNMQMKTELNRKYPSIDGNINIANADLFSLGLYADTFRFKTRIEIRAEDLSPENLMAMVRLDSTYLYKNGQQLYVDSLLMTGKIDSGQTILTLASPFANAVSTGRYKYTALPEIYQYYYSRYSGTQLIPLASADPVSLRMEVNLKPDPIFGLLLPGLFFDKDIQASAGFDTKHKDSSLNFHLAAPLLVYKTNGFSNLNVNVNGINDSLKYTIKADTVKASSLHLYTTTLTGGLGKSYISTLFSTLDKKQREKYSLSATAAISNGSYRLQLGDKLKLNYGNWNVDKKNTISYGSQGFNISQFLLSKDKEIVSLNSTSSLFNSPVDVKIDHFSLQNITGLLDKDSLEIGGLLGAHFIVEGLDKKVPVFNGSIHVDSLSYQNTIVGNVLINGKTDNNNAASFTVKLTGNGNNVDMKGSYDQQKIDAQLLLAPVELKSIEPFTKHYFTRSSGKITGNINITGTVQSPVWNGSILFDSAVTQLREYGTMLKMDKQKLELNYPSIRFSQFIIKDTLEHFVTVNGVINKEPDGMIANLTAKTTDFIAINNTAVDNPEIFGTAITDADIIINGPVSAPVITGSLHLKDHSQITYVRQQSVSGEKDGEGVVEFVNMDTLNKPRQPSKLSVMHTASQFDGMIRYDLNFDIDKNAHFNIIIDPISRDELQVQGSGQLNAGIAPNGNMFANGAYNLTKGSYQLNTKFLKRKFELQEGSTITFNGDLKNAVADITAVYEIEASPYDLLSNEISDNSNSALYRQKFPFLVILKIKGKIIQPRLSFDVQLKDKANGVNADMVSTIDNKFLQMRSDPASMNKQVFTLLVMGKFIGEQSSDFFGGSSGLQTNQVVKESVSRFLSDAISHLAADLIKGVDIELNLRTVANYSDATQRTDLNLALSKRFLDDRLSITIGKNFVVDGVDPLAKKQDNSNVQFLPDITTTYQLSKDGRYMLKAYQKSDYEVILDGYFIETGVAFTLSVDYDSVKDLLRKKKK